MRTPRISLPSLIAGAVIATALAAVPALAGISPGDRNPTVFDGKSPLLSVKPPTFLVGQTVENDDVCDRGLSSAYVNATLRYSWNATDATSGVKAYTTQSYAADSGVIDHPPTTATFIDRAASDYVLDCGGGGLYWYTRVTAEDFRGATATSPFVVDHFTTWDENGGVGHDTFNQIASPTVTRTGTWLTDSCDCYLNGTTRYTSTPGASITYTLTFDDPGRTVAIVAPKGTTRGVMAISVDGAPASRVSTHVTGPDANRVIVWQRTLETAGTHTVKVINVGTAGHPRIDVDTIMLGPAWGDLRAGEFCDGQPCV